MSLVSANPAIVSVPSEVVVSGGQSAGAFPVTTAAVAAQTLVDVTATAFGVSRTGTLTVVPGTPPAADIVAITRATWKRAPVRSETVGYVSGYAVSLGFDLEVVGGLVFGAAGTALLAVAVWNGERERVGLGVGVGL